MGASMGANWRRGGSDGGRGGYKIRLREGAGAGEEGVGAVGKIGLRAGVSGAGSGVSGAGAGAIGA